jgi:hypothetical protein
MLSIPRREEPEKTHPRPSSSGEAQEPRSEGDWDREAFR